MEEDPPATDEPFDPQPPLRLTYNPGPDLSPAALPDGEFAYAFLIPQTPNNDQCMAYLRAGGGTQDAVFCANSPGSVDSTDRFDWPLALDDGRLVFLRASKRPDKANDDFAALVVAPQDQLNSYTSIRTLPVVSSGGTLYVLASYPTDPGDGRLVFVGLRQLQAIPCPGCDPIPLTGGVELASVPLASSQATPDPIPETTSATAVANGRTSGEVIFTRAGESAVYAISPGTAASVLFDFGVGRVVRDPRLVGARLLAVVDGVVTNLPTVEGPTAQFDNGGRLVVVDLASGVETPVSDDLVLFRHPTVLTDNQTVIAEGFPTDPDGNPLTTVPDLYQLELP